MPPPLLLLLLVAAAVASLAAGDDERYNASTCQKSFPCGAGVDIHYPFFLADATTAIQGYAALSYCGYPGMAVACADGRATLRLRDRDYAVLAIDYGNNTVTVADADVLGGGGGGGDCPRVAHNVTVPEETWLNLSTAANEDLVFFFDCVFSAAVQRPPGVAAINCTGFPGRVGESFVAAQPDVPQRDDLPRVCKEVFTVPVLKYWLDEYFSRLNDDGYGKVLKHGFQLTWDPSAGPCFICEKSGGQCSYNQTGDFLDCLCSDGRVRNQGCGGMSRSLAMSPAPSPGGGPINGSHHSAQGSTGSKHTVRTALLVSIPTVVSLLVVLIAALYLRKRIRKSRRHAQMASVGHGAYEELRSSELVLYDLGTLRAATDNFSEDNKLGEGGFGPVYKGILQNGQVIAVKRLSTTSKQGLVEMKNEVVLVAKLQHKNLVRILGCCIEKHERLLVYEFLSNKSLDKILYGPARQSELSWEQKYKIIYGIGRGLMYLHEDSRLMIIHRDLKPGNILLDADMNPKISDFGLAKLFNIDDLSIASTNHLVGTRGYMAPEYVFQGIFSAKSDVFSYGVLVLEIITGRRPCEDLVKFVWRHWSQGKVPSLLDGCPLDDHAKQEMLRCIHIGLLCVQDDPQLRPRMATIVLMLNSHSMMLATPTEPIFTIPSERPRVEAPEPSINETSISHLKPR